MKKIKNILVPTDFSATARNAFHYAQGLADALDASITVVHVKEYFLPASESNLTPFFEMEEEHLLSEAIESFIGESHDEDGDIAVLTTRRVKTRILKGDPVTKLVELSAEADSDLMVIGSSIEQGFFSKIFGTTSLNLAEKAHCPVILIPNDAIWIPIRRMMYVSNYDAMTPAMIKSAGTFARTLHAVIHFVHVPDASNGTESKAAEILWEQLFSLAGENMPYQAACIYGKNIVEELEHYNHQHHINMMVFVSKQRNFWDQVFRQSLVQNIAPNAHVPMMIMHVEEKI